MSNRISYGHLNRKQAADLQNISKAEQNQCVAQSTGANAATLKAADQAVVNAYAAASKDHVSDKVLNKFAAQSFAQNTISQTQNAIKNGVSSSDTGLTQNISAAYGAYLRNNGKQDNDTNRKDFVKEMGDALQSAGVTSSDAHNLLAPLQTRNHLKVSDLLQPSKRA